MGLLVCGIFCCSLPQKQTQPALDEECSIAGNDNFRLILKSDGTLWATGWNEKGQLGLGNNVDQSEFTQVTGISNIKTITCGYNHSLVLTNDNTLYVTGGNGFGQLGLGDNSNRNSFTKVSSLSNLVFVAAGAYHTLVLTSDGKF